jgi:hypothetical protein
MTSVANVEFCFGDREHRVGRELLGSCITQPLFDSEESAAVHRFVDSLQNETRQLLMKLVFPNELKGRIPLTASAI